MMFQENGPALSFTSEFRLNSYGEPIAAIRGLSYVTLYGMLQR